uniref:Ankyrin n=1 Tax=Trichogramma kaykai TaxID=54128 RepID=A0ABD2XLZ1_9HYME
MSAPNHHRDLRFYVTHEWLDINNVSKLKSLRESVNWEIEEERCQLLDQLYPLMDDWRLLLPNLRKIFRAREINWLLVEDLRKNEQSASSFARFLSQGGYRDEPDLDEATGRPLLNGITPVHFAARHGLSLHLNLSIFRMYPARSNYVDEHGWSHFHVACRWSFSSERIQEFLGLGQDPNEPLPTTGDTPLLLRIQSGSFNRLRVQALLRACADPNLANEEGLTPLHCLCRSKDFIEFEWARLFFKLCDDVLNRPLQIDAVDNQGWTPLRYAVASILPDSVDALLNRGATVSGFVFPTELYSGGNDPSKRPLGFDLRHLYRAGGVLAIVERLEKAGYELSRADATIIMRFFHDCGSFDVASEDNERSWYSDEKWAEEAKKIAARDDTDPSQLSLYDLTRSSPREAAKLLAYKDYFDLALSVPMLTPATRVKRPSSGRTTTVAIQTLETCAVYLAEKLSRGFFESWALEPFMRLIRDRLPILCCDMILENLRNVDLYNIFAWRQICDRGRRKSCTWYKM